MNKPLEEERGRRPRVTEQVEQRVLDLSFEHPSRGQDRIARDLWAEKVHISASGVRYVWQRHNLETLPKRVDWIEQRLGRNDQHWSAEQLAARARVKSSRQTYSLGASMVGGDGVPRSMYILAVAARLFRERSVDAVSLRDIAVRSQVPLGSIYYHYQTKEELFVAVYDEGIQRLNRVLGEVMTEASDPWHRLEQACATHLTQLCGGDDFTAVSIPTKLPELPVAARNRVRQLNASYELNFRILINALPLADSVSPSLLRLQLLGALNWTSVWYQPDKMSPQGMACQLVRALRYGVEAVEPLER